MKAKRLYSLAAVAAATLLVLPQQAGQSNSYLLRVRLKPGTKATYAMNMVMTMDTSNLPKPQGQNTTAMPKTIKMNMGMNYTNVLEKVVGGKYYWKMTINSATMTSNMGQQMPNAMKDMAGKTASIVTNDRGKVLSAQGSAMQGMQNMGSGGMTGVVFPEKSVAMGATWKESVESQGMKMTVQYKLAGTKPIPGGTGLVLHSKILDNQMISTPQPMQSLINAQTGELISSSGKAKMNMMGMMGEMSITLTKK